MKLLTSSIFFLKVLVKDFTYKWELAERKLTMLLNEWSLLDILEQKASFLLQIMNVFSMVILFCLFFFFAVLRFEFRALYLLGRPSTTWATLPAVFCLALLNSS
jgi:hypothetical protein